MRTMCLLLAALAVSVTSAIAQPKNVDAAKVRAEVQQATENWLRTGSSPLDLDGFMRHYLRDPEIVIANTGRTWKGWDAIHAFHQKTWAGWKTAKFGYRTITTTVVSNETAATTIEGDYSITATSGTESSGAYVATFVWQRTPDGWRIVQQHESFPPRR